MSTDDPGVELGRNITVRHHSVSSLDTKKELQIFALNAFFSIRVGLFT